MSIFKTDGVQYVTQEEITLTQQAAAMRATGRDYEAGEAGAQIKVLASQRAARSFEQDTSQWTASDWDALNY